MYAKHYVASWSILQDFFFLFVYDSVYIHVYVLYGCLTKAWLHNRMSFNTMGWQLKCICEIWPWENIKTSWKQLPLKMESTLEAWYHKAVPPGWRNCQCTEAKTCRSWHEQSEVIRQTCWLMELSDFWKKDHAEVDNNLKTIFYQLTSLWASSDIYPQFITCSQLILPLDCIKYVACLL